MKLIADPIYLPDDATWQDIEDAKARANWRRVQTKKEMMARTNLDGKCGSCKYFHKYENDDVHGCCKIKEYHSRYRARYDKACREYEKEE